jgi:short-subunit dehydrogenase
VSVRPVALVTGGSSGIGEELARRLVGRGMRVLVTARGVERLRRVADGLGAEPVAADVATEQGRAAIIDAVRLAGRLDVLVNNAGAGGGTTALDIDVERVRRVLEVNFYAHVALTRELCGLLARPGGAVLNVSSVLGTYTADHSAAYCASKFALTAWSRALATDLRRDGVQVLTVHPGPVATTTFPHDELRRTRRGRLLVLTPERCVDDIVAALDRGATEVTSPAYLRWIAAFGALAPGTYARFVAGRV